MSKRATGMLREIRHEVSDDYLSEESGVSPAKPAQPGAAPPPVAAPAPAPASAPEDARPAVPQPPPAEPPSGDATLPPVFYQGMRPQRPQEQSFFEGRVTDYCRSTLLYDYPDESIVSKLSSDTLITPGSSMAWREKLAAIPGIKLSEVLLAWLEHWMLSEPAKTPDRRKLLEDLATLLAKHPQPGEALREWLTAHLESAFREPALSELTNSPAPV